MGPQALSHTRCCDCGREGKLRLAGVNVKGFFNGNCPVRFGLRISPLARIPYNLLERKGELRGVLNCASPDAAASAQ